VSTPGRSSPWRRALDPLKPLLVPIWNGAHRLAWTLGEYGGAVAHRRFGRCRVCGRFAPFLYRRRVVPPRLEAMWGLTPTVAEALARKESLDCASCGAKLRARRMAEVLLGLYPVGDPPAPARSVRAWIETPEAQRLRVAEFNRIDGLHTQLARLPALAYSEHQPGVPPGTTRDGLRCEDLTRPTYPDDAFDLVLTSETLEHVPDLGAALRSIRRILAPGGIHLFTVPLLPGVARTVARARLADDGAIEVLVPPLLHHPGGEVGYPVFTEFGADLVEILRRHGFAVDCAFGPPSADDLAQVWIARKPAEAAT
jgi:hypothetical protein